MALDESHEDDQVFTENGITFLVSKVLFEQVKPIAVDFVNTPRGSGFKISSSLDAASSCGSSCSC